MKAPVRVGDHGRIVVLLGRNVFKLGIILGPSRTAGRARVCSWSNAAKSWSNPFTMGWGELQDFYENASNADEGERSRRMTVGRRASAAASRAPGYQRGWGWL